MIKEKLLNRDYYLSKLSMFMKESYGLTMNVDLMLDWMKSVDSASTYLTNVLDIWNDNYKNDMIEKFGYKYIYRTLDDTNYYLRGHFEDALHTEIVISNVYVKMNNLEYSVITANSDNTSFFAVIKSEDVEFEQHGEYFYINVDKDYNLTKEIVSPVSLGLYELVSSTSKNQYIKSTDTEFEESTEYYVRDEIGYRKYKYTKANPKFLNLYEGKIYRFDYKIGNYTKTSPKENNLYIYNGNDYVPTDDTEFNPTEEYYEYYQGDYQRAYSYNLMINLYHKSLIYTNSSDSTFSSTKPYYTYKNKYVASEVKEITNLSDIIPDGQIYDQTGSEANLPFVSTNQYYKESTKEHRLVPDNLMLLEFKNNEYIFTNDDNFVDGKTYYVVKPETPVHLGLYERNGSNLIPTLDTVFEDGKAYYATSTSISQTSPALLGLSEKTFTTVICSSTEGNSFNYGTYYTNQTFDYVEFVNRGFGLIKPLKKLNVDYESDEDIVIDEGEGEDFKELDIIASIVGCSRKNKIIYEEKGVLKEELIDLSNEDLLDLIKIKVIQNNYKGTLREIIDLYRTKLNYEIYISLVPISTDADKPSYKSAACNVYLIPKKTENNEAVSKNMQKLFLYSDIFIESLGIAYNRTIVPNMDNVLWLNKDYSYKNEMATYDIAYQGEPEKRDTSTRLG